MSHAAEGELHAWLDGALQHEAPDRATRLAAHLKSCRDCRARLEEARELRERAGELLEAAAPAEGGLPPFEEVEERAASGGPSGGVGGRGRPGPGRRSPGALRTLAWAASLLLGFGVGWAARAVLQAGGEPGVVAVAERPPALEKEREDRAAEAAEGGAEAQTRAPAEGGAAAGRPATPPDGTSGRQGRGVEAEMAGARKKEARVERDVTALADAGEPVDRADEREEVAGVTLQEMSVGAAERPVAGLRAAAAPEEAYRDADPATVWIPADEGDAARWIGGTLFEVEGLAVVDVAVSTADGARIARVRQRLPSGGLLEVHQRPDRQDSPDRDRPAADPSATLDGLEVRLRGPVASDSLRALLSRLHARRP